MGACLEPTKMMIVTELVPRGDLADMLADTSIHLSMPTRIKMARGAALGMNWYETVTTPPRPHDPHPPPSQVASQLPTQ